MISAELAFYAFFCRGACLRHEPCVLDDEIQSVCQAGYLFCCRANGGLGHVIERDDGDGDVRIVQTNVGKHCFKLRGRA
jgi:hypothetical protein